MTLERLVEIAIAVAAAYTCLGAVFAIFLHASGLARIDPGVRGAGWFFRLLITPGLVALWPVFAWKWRLGEQERPISARGLRAMHRLLVQALAVLVPLAMAAALALRPAVPRVGDPVPGTAVEPAPLPEIVARYGAAFAPLPIEVRLRGDGQGRRQLELVVARDLAVPTLFLFRGAVPLGAVWGPGTRRYDLPAVGPPGGTALILYSLSRGESLGTLELSEDR